jgi:hypothetical protein
MHTALTSLQRTQFPQELKMEMAISVDRDGASLVTTIKQFLFTEEI